MITLRLFGSVIYAWLISAIVVILIGEIVENKNILEEFLSRDEDREYNLDFREIKNRIYQNLFWQNFQHQKKIHMKRISFGFFTSSDLPAFSKF